MPHKRSPEGQKRRNAKNRERYNRRKNNPIEKGANVQLKMYSVRDAKAEVYNAPFYKRSHGEAERDFANAIRDEKNPNAKFPEDFDLYYLGSYDDQTGLVAPLNTPQHIVKAVDVLNR